MAAGNVFTWGQLNYMLDQNTNRCSLMDTDASCSILPHHSSLPAMGPKLFGLTGQPIPCWGENLVQLPFQDQNFT